MALLVLALVAAPAFAEPGPLANTQLRDPAKEAQARSLMETIRCVECQGQAISDSNAAIAGDMRALIRERIERGESVAQVRAWLIQRYGDYISYDPPLTSSTIALWAAPLILLAAGVAIARSSFRKS
jgi:cytochrome c-type biogenesis protein CcmH